MNTRNFELARKLSYKSDHKHHKLGAVITKKGKVIGFGFNELKTHTKSPSPFKSKHAEFSAVINSKLSSLKGCDIYIYRETPTGKLGVSKPCTHCREMLESLNIRNIFYCDYSGFKKL